jgi:hypothetical protein
MSWLWTQGVNAGSTGQLGANAATFTVQNCTVGALERAWVTQTVASGYSGGGANQNPTLSDGTSNVWNNVFGQWYSWTAGVYTYIGCFECINTSATKLSVSISNWYAGAVSTQILLDEFTGNASSSPADGSAYSVAYVGTTTGSNVTLSGTQITTAVNGDLIDCYLFDLYSGSSKVTAISQGTGFILMQSNVSNPADACADENEVQATAGNITPSFQATISSGGADIVVVACIAWKPAGAAAGFLPYSQVPLMGPILAQ